MNLVTFFDFPLKGGSGQLSDKWMTVREQFSRLQTNTFGLTRSYARFKPREIAVLIFLYTPAFHTVAQSWVKTTAPMNDWVAVACSADAQRLVAASYQGGIYSSTNSGETWAKTSAQASAWSCLASSADGMKLVAAVYGGLIYTSTNAGAIWKPCSVPAHSWRVLSSSADGTKLFAGFIGNVLDGGLYTSADSGANWRLNETVTNDCLSIATSPDGEKLIAMTRTFPSPGGYIGSIYRSTDAGETWTTTGSNTALNLVASTDGSRGVMAIAFGGGIQGVGGGMVVTTNAGVTALLTSAPSAAWSSIANSIDGNQLVAVVGGPPTITGPIYTSADSGTNWTLTDAPTNECWTSVASSADGRRLVAVSAVVSSGTSSRQGAIYTSKTTPSPVLDISPSSENLVVSWIVPSLNFALNQATDITKAAWAPVAVAPTVNYSNLQYQVTIPKAQGTVFYRLALQ